MKKAIEKLISIKGRIGWEGYKEDCDAIDKAIIAINKIEKIKSIIDKRDNAFGGQEFGASYADLDNIIEEIREEIGEP